ncbi:glycerophosphodiester phosphodiesterase family protein [Microbacterium luticocti]|uniref:glycerophosphodiester phosphodiesterase family protein n=1 Tax=Microbacterium luticocti TaxID=451764 RepID=UPI00040667F1|nr:glycerophosphodiester phosphodiesterase family protein [Microbacterium luticocti]
MTHPWFAGSGTPRVLAHRGLVTAAAAAHGIAENSFAAVAEAHAAGAVYVESDCHLTVDGAVVLFHDATLQRVTGDPRPLAAVSLAELDALMADRGGLITLEQALDAFPTVRFNIDVKADEAAEPAGRIVAPHADRVLLTSFSDRRRGRALTAARDAGGVPATSAGTATIGRVLAALTLHSRALVRRALSGVDALQVPERHRGVRIVTPRLLDAAHRAGVEVHVWTVDEEADMRRLFALGVDGVVTDRADLALRVAAGQAPGTDR